MIRTVNGDALTASEGILVHGCNSHGVMGSGIAYKIKNKWPEVFDVYDRAYVDAYNSGKPGLDVGTITYAEITSDCGNPLFVVNGITQLNFGNDPNTVYCDYDAIRQVFKSIATLARENELTDVHFPLIGCGLANGDWEVVSQIIDEELPDADFDKFLWVLH